MAIPGLGTAANAVMKITTGSGGFLVMSMTGREQLGRLPEYEVELVGELDMMGKPKPVDMHKLLGTRANVTMDVADDPRHFNAYITRMKRGERRGRYESYTATLRPWLWFLTRSRDSRVFQTMSVKDIVSKVLTEYSTDFEFRLVSAAAYPKLDYCVQYQESDFDFVSRLLEEAGIYYFFEHTERKHTMVLIDGMARHKSRPTRGAIKWANAMKYEGTAINWQSQDEVRAAKAVVADYDYLSSNTKIEGTKAAVKPASKLGTTEVFEYPADVVQNSQKPTAQTSAEAATHRATVRIEELMSLQYISTAIVNTRDLGAGMTFEVENLPHKDDDGEYLVVGADYRLEFAAHEAIEDLRSDRRKEGFLASVTVMRVSAPNFRPERRTPRPFIHGPQTAVVVGASGNEIETDKHGRIKVQFHWDRIAKKEKKAQNSSCWVRVAQPWAGKGFGYFALPRVGHEVVVSFLDGNPDRPLVTGSVYNDENPVAWKLPDHATVSGLKTRSSKEGTADTANELRFQDEKGKEHIWFHAEKEFFRHVEGDAFDLVKGNETLKVLLTRRDVVVENVYTDIGKETMTHVGTDLHLTVGGDVLHDIGGVQQLTVAKDSTVTIGANLHVDVGAETEVNVGGKAAVATGGNFDLKVDGDAVVESTGKLSLKATGDVMAEGMNIKVKGTTNIVLEATAGITLKVGGSLVNIGPAGVDIVGPMVKINSGGGGGSAGSALTAQKAAPAKAAKPKKHEPLTEDTYKDRFKDPIPTEGGGTKP